MISKLVLYPIDSSINSRGHLVVGGCDTVDLAGEFGTPLYVFDENTLRSQCAEFRREFERSYKGTRVVYAGKAFLNSALARLLMEEGLGLDVVSGGEMSIARSVDFPMDRVYFHGNNKSAAEIRMALELGVGRIVVDNTHELALLAAMAHSMGKRPDILLRISPGVMAHTHKYVITGAVDSKFGFPMINGGDAVARALATPDVNLLGLHFHVGSLVFETEPYEQALDVILNLAAEMKQKRGFQMKELDIGGGYAVQYTEDQPAPPVSFYAGKLSAIIRERCTKLDLPLPGLVVEPGRAIVGRAGLALYQVGAIKDIPGVRCYVSVDGGMADNIRPALYGSRHEAVVASRMTEGQTRRVTVAGKFCESGDILIENIDLPGVATGDILAVADCGAYCLPMASNYNASLKPPVVMVRAGKARLIRRGETFSDLTRNDVI
jgi:diaminopimelate decarboxylase